MIITAQDNSIVNLENYEALQVVYKGSYYKSEYIISAVIFNADGDVEVETLVWIFRSEPEAVAYLSKVEKDTSYVTIVTNAMSTTKNNRILLNLARFNAVELVVSDAPPERRAGKMMAIEIVSSEKTQATVKANSI